MHAWTHASAMPRRKITPYPPPAVRVHPEFTVESSIDEIKSVLHVA